MGKKKLSSSKTSWRDTVKDSEGRELVSFCLHRVDRFLPSWLFIKNPAFVDLFLENHGSEYLLGICHNVYRDF